MKIKSFRANILFVDLFTYFEILGYETFMRALHIVFDVYESLEVIITVLICQ